MELKYNVFIIIYILFGIYMIKTLNYRNRQNGFIGAYSGTTVGFMIYYIIIPMLCILNYKNESIRNYFSRIENPQILHSIIVTFIGFIIMNFMYRQTMSKNKVETIKKSNKIDSKNVYYVFKIIAYLSFYIGTISCIVFFGSFGGFRNALNYAEYIRSFNNNLSDVISYNASLFLVTARMITVSPYAFLILIKQYKCNKYKIYLAISLLLSLLFLLFNAGRAPIIYFILSFAIIVIPKKIKKKWLLIIVAGILSLPMLDILDNLFVFFQSGAWETNSNNDYTNYILQFSHPFRNIISLNEINNTFGLRWGTDFITAFLNLIPGISFPISYENTSFFMSGENWKILGGTPNDIITFSYLQLGLIGIILIMGALGYIIGKVDKKLLLLGNDKISQIIQTIIALNMFVIVSSADFESIIRGNFIIIMLCLGLIICKEKRKDKI